MTILRPPGATIEEKMGFVAARSLPGAARGCQELPGAARSCQELPGAARSLHELLGAARSCHELPGETADVTASAPAEANFSRSQERG